MTVLNDEWTPLFGELENRVSAEGRRRLLFQCIGEIFDSTLSNFNGEMESGDMRPWRNEMLVSKDYARTVERDFATLFRTEGERSLCLGTKWEGGTGQHLKDSFVVEFNSEFASLTNVSEYASNHQLGENVPARQFFPVDENQELMPFMVNRLQGILEAHFQT